MFYFEYVYLRIKFINPLKQHFMTKKWFAGNFCPNDASCSLEDGALSPSNGPKIRTLDLKAPLEQPYLATVQAFVDEKSFYDDYTNPDEWAKCDGNLLAIGENTNLFSLLGTMYGGDGRTSFGLPDLSEVGDYYIYTISNLR